MRSRGRSPLAVLSVLLAAAACAVAGCGGSPAPTPPPPDPAAVAAAMTEAGLRARLEALAAATGDEPPYRAVGSAGYDAAADLVAGALEEAGWSVTEDDWTGVAFSDPGGSTLEVGGRTFGAGDIAPLAFAPAGEAVGRVITLDWTLDVEPGYAKGCAVTHYGTLPPGAIVLVQGGACLLRDAVLAAQTAGAAAFAAVNPELPPGVLHRPTLIEPAGIEIPAVAVSREVAEALLEAASGRRDARLVSRAETRPAPTRSILAELPGSDPGAVVMLGAHLDSVLEGPGMNDDGSGIAVLLEIAEALAGTRPRATIRLAFWSGEELGLHGSYHYAVSLKYLEHEAIAAYLNADMLASPNGFAGVYDEPAAPAGSTTLRDLLEAAVERAGGTPVRVDVGGSADHRAFGELGIPTGGVFAGVGEVSAEQAAASGSVAGLPADPCYHRPCDDIANADLRLARLLAAALADAAVQLANDPGLLPR